MIRVGDTFYMVGEDKSTGGPFQNVNCYSSTDLVEWTYVGALVSRQSSGDLGPNRVVERPKVIYNKATKKYILYMHIDSSNYGEAKVGVATGDSVCGKYSYRGSVQPMGRQSRDMGLWVDDDGTAYLLSEDVRPPLVLKNLWPIAAASSADKSPEIKRSSHLQTVRGLPFRGEFGLPME
jgi:beta-xylosidase